jgi:hypothetical protein
MRTPARKIPQARAAKTGRPELEFVLSCSRKAREAFLRHMFSNPSIQFNFHASVFGWLAIFFINHEKDRKHISVIHFIQTL